MAAPSPTLTPDEVVRIQLDGLRRAQDPQGILQCYAFASPANRAVTGPYQRFANMILSPGYRPLTTAKTVKLGKTVIQDDMATVLVSLTSSQRGVAVYRFFLSRQQEAPFTGCWMTEGVVGLAPPPQAIPTQTPLENAGPAT